MRKKIIKFLITGTIIVSGLLIGSGLAIANSLDTANKIDITAKYYKEANDIVNQQINDLFIFFEELDSTDPEFLNILSTAIAPPLDFNLTIEEIKDYCNAPNTFSTICLQNKLSELYILYNNAVQSSPDSTLTTLPSRITTDLAPIANNEMLFVKEQDETIRHINILVTELYRQILLTYPIHLQNKEIYNHLKQVRSDLKKLKQPFAVYSNLFHDATTAECM